LGGSDKWEKVATQWSQALVSQWAGVPEQARLLLQRRDARIGVKRHQAGSILQEMKKLSPNGQNLLVEAMESNAVAIQRGFREGGLDRVSLDYLDDFVKRLDREGVDHDLFWSAYERMQGVETSMVEEMYRQGMVTGQEFEEMYAVHLRRMYDYYENPQNALERVNALLARKPETGIDPARIAALENDYFVYPKREMDRRLARVQTRGNNIYLEDQPRRVRDEVRAGTREVFDLDAAARTFGAPQSYAQTDDLLTKYYATPTDSQIVSTARRRQLPPEQRRDFVRTATERATQNGDPAEWWAAARLEPDAARAIEYAERGLAAAKESGNAAYVRGFTRYLADLDATGARDLTTQRYFRLGDGRVGFNAENFQTDLNDMLKANPDATPDEILGHVKDVMFSGYQTEPRFLAEVMNTIQNGGTIRPGLRTIRDRLASPNELPTNGWSVYRESMENIAAREDIPEDIREFVLGEILEPAPRFVEGTMRGAEVLETTRMFDEMSGAVRVNEDFANLRRSVATGDMDLPEALESAREMVQNNPRLRELVDADNLQDLQRLITADETEVALRRGSRLASNDMMPEMGHTVKLPNNPDLGSMSGMYTSPGLAAQLTRLAGPGPTTGTRNVWMKIGDAVRNGTSIFKQFKIILEPGAHFRDFVGSMMQVDVMTGGKMPFKVHRLGQTIESYREFATTGANHYVDIAAEVGLDLMASTFTAAELRRRAADFSQVSYKWGPTTWRETTERFFRTLATPGKRYTDAMGSMYQHRENLFRTYVFSSTYEDIIERAVRQGAERTRDLELRAASQAATRVNQTLFNYADLPVAAEFAREYCIIPFLTFPFKAVPQAASVMYERPWRILKYERGLEEWNHHFAGGSEEFAQEVAALPEHKRDALTVRLPYEDVDGRSLHLDLSYFMPWYVIRDLQKDAISPFVRTFGEPEDEGLQDAAMGEMGLRSNLLTPPIMALYNGIANNKDGLGRPIIKPSMTADQRAQALGNFVFQFWAPPSFPGGTTADSIGRAMQALTFKEGEANPLIDILTRWSRATPSGDLPNDAVNRYYERPTSRANVGGSTIGQLFGAEPGSTVDQLVGGFEGLFTNVTASDPVQAARNTQTRFNLSNTEIQREIAQIMRNPNMSVDEKNSEIMRLRMIQQQLRQDMTERISSIF
jgi:hypothetical protein